MRCGQIVPHCDFCLYFVENNMCVSGWGGLGWLTLKFAIVEGPAKNCGLSWYAAIMINAVGVHSEHPDLWPSGM